MQKKEDFKEITSDIDSICDNKKYSRRDFIHSLSATSFGLFGMGAFISSCGKKEITVSSDLAMAYCKGVLDILKIVHEREFPTIRKAAALGIQAKMQGHFLFSKMVDGMLPGETSNSRPGMPNIYRTDKLRNAVRDDFIVTNDPYATHGLTERLIKVIGISKPSLLNKETPPKSLNNMGTFRIEDVSHLVIYTHISPEDGIVKVKGLEYPLGPVSGIIQSYVFHVLTAEIMEGLIKEGMYPKIG
ncbi:MAG: hypothetical protein WCU00_11650 [Candidatus Latescibacterota bacterium]